MILEKHLFFTCLFSLASQGICKNVNTNKWLNHIQDFTFNPGFCGGMWGPAAVSLLLGSFKEYNGFGLKYGTLICACSKSKQSYLIKQCTVLRNRQYEHGPDGIDRVKSEKLQHVHLAILRSKYE